MHVEWLQGATARNLKYDIQGTFISTPTTFSGYKKFYFDDPSKIFNSEESKVISGVTDAAGDATIKARFETGASAPGMLLASFVTRVYEESGDLASMLTGRSIHPTVAMPASSRPSKTGNH